MPRLTNTGTKF